MDSSVVEKNTMHDVLIVWELSIVFPEDLSGVPLERHVEFQIDLVWGRLW